VLDVTSSADLIPRGGLRLGRRWAWLAGAPPTLTATGLERGDLGRGDGDPVEGDSDGVGHDGGRLVRRGTHVVQAGRLTRRVEIVDASLTNPSPTDEDRGNLSRATALPVGAWIIVGANADDVARATSNRWARGTVVASSFDPVWAIEFGGG